MTRDGIEIEFDEKRGYLHLACEADAFAPYREIAREQLKDIPDVSVAKASRFTLLTPQHSLRGEMRPGAAL